MLVLMIDDDLDFVTVWRHILQREGFDVASATSVSGAQRFLARKRPDLILCDADVPDLAMSGFCRQFAGNQRKQPTPIIITGEKGNSRLGREFLRRGAVSYLPKPFKRDEILQLLHNVLSQQRQDQNVGCALSPKRNPFFYSWFII